MKVFTNPSHRLFLTIFLALLTNLYSYGQDSTKVTLVGSMKLRELLNAIERQTDYHFNFRPEDVATQENIAANWTGQPLFGILDQVLPPRGLSYKTFGKQISLRKASISPSPADQKKHRTLEGRVTDLEGNPIEAATIAVQGTAEGTQTNGKGVFQLTDINPGKVLMISHTAFEPVEIAVGKETRPVHVFMRQRTNSLDETIVIAYGTTSRRFNTGAVGKVSSAVISRQPVNNPLATLAGRVAGMQVTESNGNPGSAVNIQIRGRSSITQGSNPLFIVDGIPYPNSTIGYNAYSQVPIASRFTSPLAALNPSDIESIEILKDADATAIYGSRGANGVVLITTKKGRSGAAKYSINVYTGVGKVTRRVDLLGTSDYLTLRREAFKFDSVSPTIANAPDLLAWDTTRYIDWQDRIIGGTAHFTKADASVTGGSENTQFLMAGNYSRQTTVYPGDFANNKAGLHANIDHRSVNKRFALGLSTIFNYDKNLLPSGDGTSLINFAPNLPEPYDEKGKLRWVENGASFLNPMSFVHRVSQLETRSWVTSLKVQVHLAKGFQFKTNFGYSTIHTEQYSLSPISSQNPASAPSGSAIFSNNSLESIIIEPQLTYTVQVGDLRLDVLAGGTYQQDDGRRSFLTAAGYKNDDVLLAPEFATSLTSTASRSLYRYNAGFGKVGLRYKDRYLLNLTGRRDGSSRFGPGRQFANFGSAGAAWIFSEEPVFRKSSIWSYGKLRASYGVTGNDQIGDYQFLDNYVATRYPYQGQPGIIPARLFNPDYGWEKNKKMEAGLELGFFKDKLLLEAAYFKNRSDNQLISYRLPAQTGFNNVLQNFSALVDNSGWELGLSYQFQQGGFSWRSALNGTFIRNELLEFPGLASSSYAYSYYLGQSLGIVRLIPSDGVDPKTGLFVLPGTSIPQDMSLSRNLDPRFFGGWDNVLTYKSFELSFFFQFHVQDGLNYLAFGASSVPGSQFNQPQFVFDGRWKGPGDDAAYQRATRGGVSSRQFMNWANYSAGKISDASFVRLKNLMLAYNLPGKLLSRTGLTSCRIYVQGQNLLTFTNYLGSDPETNSTGTLFGNLPPLRMMVAGINLSL